MGTANDGRGGFLRNNLCNRVCFVVRLAAFQDYIQTFFFFSQKISNDCNSHRTFKQVTITKECFLPFKQAPETLDSRELDANSLVLLGRQNDKSNQPHSHLPPLHLRDLSPLFSKMKEHFLRKKTTSPGKRKLGEDFYRLETSHRSQGIFHHSRETMEGIAEILLQRKTVTFKTASPTKFLIWQPLVMLNICCYGPKVRCDLNSITELFIHAAHTEKRNIIENLLGKNFFPFQNLSWGTGRTRRQDSDQEEVVLVGTGTSYHPIHTFSTL